MQSKAIPERDNKFNNKMKPFKWKLIQQSTIHEMMTFFYINIMAIKSTFTDSNLNVGRYGRIGVAEH